MDPEQVLALNNTEVEPALSNSYKSRICNVKSHRSVCSVDLRGLHIMLHRAYGLVYQYLPFRMLLVHPYPHRRGMTTVISLCSRYLKKNLQVLGYETNWALNLILSELFFIYCSFHPETASIPHICRYLVPQMVKRSNVIMGLTCPFVVHSGVLPGHVAAYRAYAVNAAMYGLVFHLHRL